MIDLKAKVLYCLSKDLESRNSDIRLMKMVWWEYHNSKLFQNLEGDTCVRLKDLDDLPREDHIKRIRAKIQNEEYRYLPTRLEVVKARKINEDKWRNYLQNIQ